MTVKKLVSFLCIIFLLPTMLISSCTSKTTPVEPMNLEYSAYFTSSMIPLSHVGDTDLLNVTFSEEYAVIIRSVYPEGYWDAEQRYFDENLYETQGGYTDSSGNPIAPEIYLEVYNYNGDLLQSTPLEDTFSLSWSTPSVSISADGVILVVLPCANTENLDIRYEFARFRPDGSRIGDRGVLAPQDYMLLSSKAEADVAGNIYLAGTKMTTTASVDCIFIFSGSGAYLETIELKDRSFFAFATVGNVLYSVSYMADANGLDTVVLDEINQKSFSLGKTTTLPQEFSGLTNIDGDASSLYISDPTKISRFSLTNQTTDTVLTWSDLEAQKDSMISMACLSEDRIAFLGHSPAMGTYELVILNGSEKDPNLSKEIITLGGVDISDDPIIDEIVYRFNATQTDYRVEIVDYGEKYPYPEYDEDRMEKIYNAFYMDFFTNGGPDILIDPNNVLPFLSISSSSQYVDLTDYIQNDPNTLPDELNSGIMFPSLTDAGVYSVPSAYNVYGLIGSGSAYAPESWTIDEFQSSANEDSSGIAFLAGSSSRDLLMGSLFYSLDDFVNLDTNTVSFDSDEFLQVLEWAEEYGADSNEGSGAMSVLTGQSSYGVASIDSAFNFISNYVECYHSDFSFAPFPSSKEQHLLALPAYRFAISSQCEYPDQAWECVSELLSPDMQKVLARAYVPLRYDALDWSVKESADKVKSLDPELTATVSEKYLTYVKSADSVAYCDADMMNLILEEADAFFNGQKSAEETAAVIQNRVQMLIDEK